MTAAGPRAALPQRAAAGLPAPGARAVVGCSGGRDSVCALDAAVAVLGPAAVLAVHVHHGLRGASADGDARHVAVLAARLGCAAASGRLSPPPRPTAAWARAARREALEAAARGWGSPGPPAALVLGHTLTDQAEGVLLRLLSAPGTRALRGMTAAGEDGAWRPLLAAGADRAEAAAWCAAQGLSWREDPANPLGPRGRLRALLPALRAIEPRTVVALAEHAARAREDEAALEALAAALDRRPEGLSRAALAAAPPAVARRALRRRAEAVAGRPCPRAAGRLEDVLALDPLRGGAVDVGDGVRVVGRGDLVACEPTPPR